MPKKILLVDDDDALTEALTLLLEGEGYGVRQWDDGRTAMGEIHKFRPDILVLDFMLPGKTGIEILKEVRGSVDGIAKLPVIMISASVNVRGQAKEFGVNKFLAKPFEIEALVEALNELA